MIKRHDDSYHIVSAAKPIEAGNVDSYLIQINAGGAFAPMLVAIRPDGTLEYGPSYTPDAAARLFWETISEEYKAMLRWKEQHPEGPIQ